MTKKPKDRESEKPKDDSGTTDERIGAYLISRLEEKDLRNDVAMRMVKNLEIRWRECERVSEAFHVQGENNAAAYARGMSEGFRQAIDTICYYAE